MKATKHHVQGRRFFIDWRCDCNVESITAHGATTRRLDTADCAAPTTASRRVLAFAVIFEHRALAIIRRFGRRRDCEPWAVRT
jgi:hypothetical protein